MHNNRSCKMQDLYEKIKLYLINNESCQKSDIKMTNDFVNNNNFEKIEEILKNYFINSFKHKKNDQNYISFFKEYIKLNLSKDINQKWINEMKQISDDQQTDEFEQYIHNIIHKEKDSSPLHDSNISDIISDKTECSFTQNKSLSTYSTFSQSFDIIDQVLTKKNMSNISKKQTMDERIKLNTDFVDENELNSKNVIYFKNAKEQSSILYISINFFIKKIALDKYSLTNKDEVKAFIHQCRYFISIEKMIIKITKAIHYYKKEEKCIDNIISFLNDILITYYYELSDELRNTLRNFYKELNTIKINETVHYDNEIILSLLEGSSVDTFDIAYSKMLINGGRKKRPEIFVKKPAQLQKQNNKKSFYFHVLDWNETQIAQQLSYISYSLLLNINKDELYNKHYLLDNKKELSPNVMKVIERSDKLFLFILEDICSYYNLQTRIKVVEKWVNIALKCKEMNNLNDLMSFNILFQNHELKKLKETMKRISPKAKSIIKQIISFCSFEQRYQHFRNTIQECINNKRSYIPYLGILLKDISFYEESMDYIKNNLINIEKLKIINNLINSFFKFSEFPLQVDTNEDLDLFTNLCPLPKDKIELMINHLETKAFIEKNKNEPMKKKKSQTEQNLFVIKFYSNSNIYESVFDNYYK